MATAVQSIILDPFKLFNYPTDHLRSELKTSPRSELKALIKAVSNQEWLLHLPPEQQLQCEKTLLLTLPKHTPRDCLDVFLGIFRNLQVPERDEDFGVELMRSNREIALQSIHAQFQREFPDVEPSDDLLCLYLIREEYMESGRSKYLKLILKQGIDVGCKIDGEDLLFVVAEDGSADDLQLTLDYYRMRKGGGFRKFLSERMEELVDISLGNPENMLVLMRACLSSRLEPITWLQHIDWIAEPTSFEVVKRWLDPSVIRSFYQANGLHLLLDAAFLDDESFVEVQHRLRSSGVEPKDFFPKRVGNELTSIEKALLMLGKREACKRIVKLTVNDSGLKVRISRSDRLYRHFKPNESREMLHKLYVEIKAKMTLPLERRKNSRGVVTMIDREKFREIWNDPEMVRLVDKFLSMAIVEAFYILRDSFEKSGHDKKVMTKLLNNQMKEGPRYIHCFLHRSFVSIYHTARSMRVSIPKFYFIPSLLRDDEVPFFNPGSPQYHWRQMYNALQICLDKFGLRDLHEDYYNWTAPDIQYQTLPDQEKRIGTPSLKPSYWMYTLT